MARLRRDVGRGPPAVQLPTLSPGRSAWWADYKTALTQMASEWKKADASLKARIKLEEDGKAEWRSKVTTRVYSALPTATLSSSSLVVVIANPLWQPTPTWLAAPR